MQKTDVHGTITVPVLDHPELRKGTLCTIIRQLGVPRAMFEDG
ncbi:MAG: type II toxin-antitoxin system HicA family toxin [Aestuariivita sp.]|nr:type II toxin-antitoxin system HicA family toxin [Aestuariivita sp.]MCY4201437.1 type II toxin-antitoxin system HicA family toxin [Aestuariivita sp.]MCY4289834.1 type II toxin-antitoxin system HicA family toxin [Aestuariivita sp.]MCY4347889.1 type II toxin-antitoxin system HicA family toxin [Aestuariivita sp.]